jgi:hypothetical protein
MFIDQGGHLLYLFKQFLKISLLQGWRIEELIALLIVFLHHSNFPLIEQILTIIFRPYHLLQFYPIASFSSFLYSLFYFWIELWRSLDFRFCIKLSVAFSFSLCLFSIYSLKLNGFAASELGVFKITPQFSQNFPPTLCWFRPHVWQNIPKTKQQFTWNIKAIVLCKLIYNTVNIQ